MPTGSVPQTRCHRNISGNCADRLCPALPPPLVKSAPTPQLAATPSLQNIMSACRTEDSLRSNNKHRATAFRSFFILSMKALAHTMLIGRKTSLHAEEPCQAQGAFSRLITCQNGTRTHSITHYETTQPIASGLGRKPLLAILKVLLRGFCAAFDPCLA